MNLTIAKVIRKLDLIYGIHIFPDKPYLEALYKYTFGVDIDWDKPRTFNEKLQWLKLHDRNPHYTEMVDKYAAKEWARNKIGEKYIIPTLGVWDSFDDIDFDTLPSQFVLKCTHDSGGLVICKDKRYFNKQEAKRKINESLKRNFYWVGREWPYKNVRPRIIAEKYMEDESGYELKDYKIYNFGGKPQLIQVDYDRFVSHKRNLYSPGWDYVEAEIIYPSLAKQQIAKPKQLEEMLELAKQLSEKTKFLRTDFYSIENKIFFGELTFYPETGLGKMKPEYFDVHLGTLIDIPNGGGYGIIGDGFTLWLHDKYEYELKDYKFFCFDGVPAFFKLDFNRSVSHRANYYDLKGNILEIGEEICPPDYEKSFYFSQNELSEMIDIASLLSKSLLFARIDLYSTIKGIYFGECTLYPASGFGRFSTSEQDGKIGEYVKLR